MLCDLRFDYITSLASRLQSSQQVCDTYHDENGGVSWKAADSATDVSGQTTKRFFARQRDKLPEAFTLHVEEGHGDVAGHAGWQDGVAQ